MSGYDAEIINGHFKKWGGLPSKNPQVGEGWEIYSPNKTAVPEKCGEGLKDKTVHSGDFCQGWSGEKGDGIMQRIKVKPDTYYVIAFWSKFAGPGGGMLKNWDYYEDALHTEVKGKSGKIYCCIKGSAVPWTKLHVYFTTDRDETEVTFKCYQMKKGKYYIDDVSISKGEKEKVRVSNSNHIKIYYPEKVPRFTEWVNMIKLPNGDINITFNELVGSGKMPDLPKIYSSWFTEKGAEDRKKYGAEFKQRMVKSTDKGKTWKLVKEYDSSLKVSSDGRETYWNYSQDRKRILKLGKDGIYSSIDCLNWKKEFKVDMSKAEHYTDYEGDVLELKDGTLMIYYVGRDRSVPQREFEIPYDKNKLENKEKEFWGGVDYNDLTETKENVYTIKMEVWDAYAYISPDKGKTWYEKKVAPCYMSEKKDDYINWTEVTAVEANSGDVLFILRSEVPWPEMKWGKEDTYRQVTFFKKGKEWVSGEVTKTPLDPVLFLGHPCIMKMKNGILVAGGSSHQYMFSVDDGKTWEVRNLAFGLRRMHYVRIIEVSDGKLLAVAHMGADWPYPPFEDQWINGTFFDVEKRK